MKAFAFVICATAATVGCAEQHVLRSGALPESVAFVSGDPEINLEGIKAGFGWTNIFIDVTVVAKSAEAVVEPSEFSLFVPATGMTMPASQRRIWQGRRDDFPGGTADPTLATRVPPGAKMAVTLVFETSEGGAEDIRAVELIWRGHRVAMPQPTRKESSDAPAGMVEVRKPK